MKKRILSIALVVVMIVAMIPAMLIPTAAIGYYDGYDGTIVSDGAIDVDGSATPDEAYLSGEKIVSTLHYDDRNSSGETSSFEAYVAADDGGFYFWISVVDQSTDKGEGFEYNNEDEGTIETKYEDANGGDRVELYIRADGTDAAARNAGHIGFDYLGQLTKNVRYGTHDTSLVDYATTLTDYGWVGEIYVPWVALDAGYEGYTLDDMRSLAIGVQCNNALNDDSNAHKAYCYDSRQGTSYYRGMFSGHTWASSDNNNTYQGSRLIPVNFVGIKTAVVGATLAVDGKMDAEYLLSQKITPYAAVGAGDNFTAYTVATAAGLYVFADIIDSTLDKPAGEVVDQGDKFQFYFQMGARLSNANWGYIEMDYREEGEYTTSNFRYVDKASGWYANAPAEANILHATTKTNTGWTAEVFVPWAGSISIDGLNGYASGNVGVMLQVNNYTSTPNGSGGFDRSAIDLSYSNRWGERAWYANNGGSGGPSGNFWFAPLVFDFKATAPETINRWANYSATDLVLDGVKDAAYNEFAVDLVDTVYVSGSQGATETLAGGWHYGDFVIGKGYYTFTDTDMYVYFEVYDNSVAPDGSTTEYACIYYETSTHAGKWNLGPDQSYNTNAAYEGTAVSYPAIDPETLSNGVNLAISYYKEDGEGTKTDYDSYAIEFKMPLPEAEREALAAGESVLIGMGLEVNDSKASIEGDAWYNGQRQWYGYSAPNGSYWYQSGINLGHVSMPKVVLDKTFTATSYDVETKITAAQVALGDSIDVNYFATLPLNATDAIMEFTFNGATYYAPAAKTTEANEYMFTFEGIAPQCLGDNIAAKLIVNGAVVAEKAEYSVFQNCLNIALADLDNAPLIALVGNLGAYGAAAQVYANYKTDALVNEGYEHFATPVNSIDNNDRAVEGTIEGARISAAGVYHANTNKLYAKVFVEDETVLDFLTVTINGVPAAIKAISEANTYIVFTDDIKATEFADVYTFVVSDGLGSQTLEYSVNAYAKAKLDAENDATAALAKALYAYGASAVAYAG